LLAGIPTIIHPNIESGKAHGADVTWKPQDIVTLVVAIPFQPHFSFRIQSLQIVSPLGQDLALTGK
jgi:hypothetical protein